MIKEIVMSNWSTVELLIEAFILGGIVGLVFAVVGELNF